MELDKTEKLTKVLFSESGRAFVYTDLDEKRNWLATYVVLPDGYVRTSLLREPVDNDLADEIRLFVKQWRENQKNV